MAQLVSASQREQLQSFLKKNRKSDLVSTYLFFIEGKLHLEPVAFPAGKLVFENVDKAIEHLEKKGQLWHEAEIRIYFSREAVNDETKRVYICPFDGTVFGDNTQINPQDAIYSHVASCPKNIERVGGLKAKRFFVSEDPEVIANYKEERRAPVQKKVFSSVVTGKLFNSREAIIRDFRENHVKPINVIDALNQNKFDIEPLFLEFLQAQLEESKLSSFIEGLSEDDFFIPHIERWLESEEEDEESEE